MKEITEPTLLLDEQRCRSNIRRMSEKARRHNIVLKPHFKTHQSARIGQWFWEEGIRGITVTSVRMAQYFVPEKWEDITIAFPANQRQAEEINTLASQVNLTIFINSAETAKFFGEKLHHPVQVMVEIDTGNHRTGLPSAQKGEIAKVLGAIAAQPVLQLLGFYVHPGHSYQAASIREVQGIYDTTRQQLIELQEVFSREFGPLKIAMGDTPTGSLVDSWQGLDQMHPGNFVFYDLMQHRIGSCTYDQIAVCVACPLVEKRPERQELIVYGGAVHFSKDRLTHQDGASYYGQVVRIQPTGWSEPVEGCYVKAVSQEHGLLRVSRQYFEEVTLGDLIGILPVHSCLTANLMKRYRSLSGESISML